MTSRFGTQVFNLLGHDMLVLAALASVRDPEMDWSGTGIPNEEVRKRLREEAKRALKDDSVNRAFTAKVWNRFPANGNGVVDIEHVIIGAGYAALMNAATLPTGPMSQPSGLPSTIMVAAEDEPWARYASKPMGQSPANLSPGAFPILPLHFTEAEPPEKPHDCLDPSCCFIHCFLKSTYFAYAIALSRKRLGFPVLRATVDGIIELQDSFEIRVKIEGDQVDAVPDSASRIGIIRAKKVDIASGPGPPRQLPPSQFDDQVRHALRQTGTDFQAHVFGGEALLADEDLAPPGKKILIYGGSPTSAWVYERIFSLASITTGATPSPPAPTVFWVAPYRGPEGDLSEEEKKIAAFADVDLGLRNKLVLEHSKDDRYVAEITQVEKLQGEDKATVTFDAALGSHGTSIKFDQVIESIGRDPERPGGVNTLLSDFTNGPPRFRIIEDKHTTRPPAGRPLGLRLETDPSTGKRLRILGAAAVAAATFPFLPGNVVTDPDSGVSGLADVGPDVSVEKDYHDRLSAFLNTLPEEARVPPGITVHGVLIPRVNDPDYGLTASKVNINTFSQVEIADHHLDLFSDAAAACVIPCRSQRVEIPPLPNQPPPSAEWFPGFPGIQDLKRCSGPGCNEVDYDRVKAHIRV